MTIAEIVIFLIILAAVVCGAIFIFADSKRRHAEHKLSMDFLAKQIEALRTVSQNSGEKLQDAVHKNLSLSLEKLGELNKQLGLLAAASNRMQEIGSDIGKLHDILRSPKLRGNLGEWSLETILANTLPQGSFSLQYKMADGKIVDAIVRLAEHNVPIDAKFPMENFVRTQDAADNEKAKYRRDFLRDVQKHIDKISADYIRPSEGTLDFALMYVPAENVYYETVMQNNGDTLNIMQYAIDKKVIPVSPNLLYIYLMTVAMGLHGMQIEKQAAEIRQNLGTLHISFMDFITAWDTLGTHLRNACAKYDEGQKKLDKFTMQLDQTAGKKNEE